MPSLGSGEATAVASTTLSPSVTNAAPEACLAMRPVSKTRRLPPVSSTATSCFIGDLFHSIVYSFGKLDRQQSPHAKNPHGAQCSMRVPMHKCGAVAERQVHLGHGTYARSQPRPLHGLGRSCSKIRFAYLRM